MKRRREKTPEEDTKQVKELEKSQAKKFGYLYIDDLRAAISSKEIFNRIFQANARTGQDAAAAFNIARCYIFGIQEAVDIEKAIGWLRVAANLNVKASIPAKYNLALLYAKGFGAEEDKKDFKEKAFQLFLECAKAGYTLAQTNVATCYLRQEGVAPSAHHLKEAYRWFKVAVEGGDPKAKKGLGICVAFLKRYQVKVPENQTESQVLSNEATAVQQTWFEYRNLENLKTMDSRQFTKLKEKAFRKEESTDRQKLKKAKANFDLARCYGHGITVKADVETAMVYYQASAKLGFAPAQEALGVIYLKKNNEVPPSVGAVSNPKENAELAFENFALAARQGYARAQCNLAYCYAKNIGVQATPRNMRIAFDWYMRAALQGHPQSERNVVKLRLKNEGIPTELQSKEKNKESTKEDAEPRAIDSANARESANSKEGVESMVIDSGNAAASSASASSTEGSKEKTSHAGSESGEERPKKKPKR